MPEMEFATGEPPVMQAPMDFFSGLSQIEPGSEMATVIESFHRIRSSTTLLGPMPDRQTNIEVTNQSMVESFYQVAAQLATRRKGNGKGKKGKPNTDAVFYSGDNTSCTICSNDFVHNDQVVRLQCQHVFHETCWSEYAAHEGQPVLMCCNCRMNMETNTAVIAHYGYLPARASRDTRQTSDSDDGGYASASSTQAMVTYGAYIIEPKVNGRLTMIVDIGAFINLMGANLARQIAIEGRKYGHYPTEVKLDRPLYIHGVGQGSQQCNWSVNVPAAVRTKTPPTAISSSSQSSSTGDEHERESATLVRIESPTCQGSGSGLPGLLGLRTIEANNGVIETINGSAFLTFPGPGGYKIVWEPGALHMPLVKAPSGHLCLELDHYDKVSTATGGVPDKSTIILYSGRNNGDAASQPPTTTTTTASIEVQTDPVVSS